MSKILTASLPRFLDADFGTYVIAAEEQVDAAAEKLRSLAEQVDDPNLRQKLLEEISSL